VKILIIASSHEQLGNTGRKTGSWLEALAIPYYIFKEAGGIITFGSPLGGPLPLDPKSESIIVSTSTTRRFQKDQEVIDELSHSIPLGNLHAADFDMALLAGGHGPLWDFTGNEILKRFLEDMNGQGKIIGLISHGMSGLLSLQNSVGKPFVRDRHLTAFSDSEEQVAGLTGIVPFSLESSLFSSGAFYTKGPDFCSYAVTDKNIVSGQNPASSKEVSRRMVALFKEYSLQPHH
jgi:putative intracellular protease/amidase